MNVLSSVAFLVLSAIVCLSQARSLTLASDPYQNLLGLGGLHGRHFFGSNLFADPSATLQPDLIRIQAIANDFQNQLINHNAAVHAAALAGAGGAAASAGASAAAQRPLFYRPRAFNANQLDIDAIGAQLLGESGIEEAGQLQQLYGDYNGDNGVGYEQYLSPPLVGGDNDYQDYGGDQF